MKNTALGIELSTQSAKAVVLDVESGEISHTAKLDFDERFPSYGTDGGVLPHEDSHVRQADPRMLVEALDTLIADLAGSGLDMAAIGAVKLDAMQHCTVYVNRTFDAQLTSMQEAPNLLNHFKDTFSRNRAPIWEDRSTQAEAEFLTEALAEAGGIRNLTGNNAELRFPGPQIMKWAKAEPAAYDETARIFLLSAFLTSLLAGTPAPVDTGDGYGSNLNMLDIHHPAWSPEAVAAAEQYFGKPDTLAKKLGRMDHYDAPVGSVGGYWIKRFGFSPDCTVLAGTGDNPATLLGCGGQAVVSLGSSYTVNGVMQDPHTLPDGFYNVFGYTPGTAMALTCFTNGAKLHDAFMEKYVTNGKEPEHEDWIRYQQMFGEPRLSPEEPLMLPYELDESVPPHSAGIKREGFDDSEASVNIRALHVSQVAALKKYSGHLAVPKRLCVVGGGSKNPVMRQLIADAFGAETCVIDHADSAAPLGCAVSAVRYMLDASYEEAAERYVHVDANSILAPNKVNTTIFDTLIQRWDELL